MDPANRLELRPMGVGDILDTALRLYRSRLIPFLTIALIMYVPYTILVVLLNAEFAEPPQVVQGPFGPRVVESTGTTLVNALDGLLLFLFVLPLVQSAMMVNISATYLGEQIDAATSYRRAARRVLALLGTQWLAGIVIVIGYLLLIVPGIVFSLWYLILGPIVVLEGISGGRAMSRSKALMSGNLGKGFLLMLVVVLLNLALTWAVGYCVGLLGRHLLLDGIVQNLLQAVLLPFSVAPSILLYYDLRIRKEAFDLQRLTEVLAAPVPA